MVCAGRSAACLERVRLPAWGAAGAAARPGLLPSPGSSPGAAPAIALGPHFIADAAARAAPAVVHVAVAPPPARLADSQFAPQARRHGLHGGAEQAGPLQAVLAAAGAALRSAKRAHARCCCVRLA